MLKGSSLMGTFPLVPLEPCPSNSMINMISFITSESLRPPNPWEVPMEANSKYVTMAPFMEVLPWPMSPQTPD